MKVCNNEPMQIKIQKGKKNFMAPFHGWGSTASRLEPLWGGSSIFTTRNTSRVYCSTVAFEGVKEY